MLHTIVVTVVAIFLIMIFVPERVSDSILAGAVYFGFALACLATGCIAIGLFVWFVC